ncbi:MAG: TetR/AcrR family transcriptional regulator [Candidatus Nanopelagicales bacterium]
MPKVVDHEERRRNIAEAVYRLIGTNGMDAVSLRDVAQEAGVSMGAVQHYFKTKDDMLLFALGYMRERVLPRLQSALDKLPDPTTRERTRAAITLMLPLDKQSTQEATVNIAFFANSFGNKETQAKLREGYRALYEASRQSLKDAAESGELRSIEDVDQAAAELFYLVQGLIGPTLIGAMSKKEAVTVVDNKLDALFR